MGVVEILEKYLPDYHRNDDIARMDDLCKYINNEMTEAEEKEKNLFDEDIPTVFAEFLELQEKLHAEALQNFADKLCEKQRMLCVGQIIGLSMELDASDEKLSVCQSVSLIKEDIKNASQPKIDEL